MKKHRIEAVAAGKESVPTQPYDASEFLDDAESQAELLSQALATGKTSVVAHALGVIARARGMTELQRMTGLTRSALYAGLSEDGNPTLDTVMKVIAALNLELGAHPSKAA